VAATKFCPSCDAEIPASATRCKDCFHDFTEDTVPTRNNSPLILLGILALMAVIGASTLGIISTWPTDQQILVEEESQSIVFVSKYQWGESTERTPFSQIAALEHVIEPNGEYKTVAITLDGSRIILNRSKKSLKGPTESYARIMEKPFNEVDHTTGFFSKENIQKIRERERQGAPPSGQ